MFGPLVSAKTAASVTGTASVAWPAANRAIYMPMWIPAPYPVAKVWWANGATASGNTNLGIYAGSGVLLASTGSTVQSGTTVVQSVTLSLLLTPGLYYFALIHSNTTGTFRRVTATSTVSAATGIAQEAVGSLTLPATMTPAAMTSSYVPVCGITSITTI